MKKRILLGAFLFAGTAFGFAKSSQVENLKKTKSVDDICLRVVRHTETTITYDQSTGETTTTTTTVQYSYEIPCAPTFEVPTFTLN